MRVGPSGRQIISALWGGALRWVGAIVHRSQAGATVKELNTAVDKLAGLCELTARPARTAPLRLGSDALELASGVQVSPSVDVAAANVVPLLETWRYTGAVAAICISWMAVLPWASLDCTTMPLWAVWY